MTAIKNGGTIYLSGGGDKFKTFPLDKIFFGSLPKNGRLLYVPIALRERPRLYAGATKWMRGILSLHRRGDIKLEVWRNISGKLFRDIERFDAIYIGGGNIWSLFREIKETGLDSKLIGYLRSGGIIYGGSAGAVIFGKKISAQRDENKVGWRNDRGLDLLGGYSIFCHYRASDRGELEGWARQNNSNLICLSEGSGLIMIKKKMLCVGSRPCFVFFKKAARRRASMLRHGDSLKLK